MSSSLRPARLRLGLLEAGVPIEVISKRLRHANLSITSDLYAHLSGKLDRQVAEQGAAYILGGS